MRHQVLGALCLAASIAAAAPVFAQSQSTLFGSSRDGELFALDITTGVGTPVGGLTDVCPGGFGTATEIEYDNTAQRAFAQARGDAFCGGEFDITNGRPIGGAITNGLRFTGLEVVGGTWYGTAISTMGGPSDLRSLDPFAGTSTPIGLTGVGPISGLAHDGSTMYGIAGGMGPSDLYTVDLSTGVATVVGSTGIQAGSLQFGPDGNLYAGGTGSADSGKLFMIDKATGISTLVGATGFGTVTGLTLVDNSNFSCSTVLYGADGAGGIPGSLYVLDPSTGTTSTIGPIGFPLTGLASHPVTCALWGVTSQRFDVIDNPSPGHLITIDKSTGAGTLVGDIFSLTDSGAAGITFTSNGALYGRSPVTDELITIDLGTGAGTVVGSSGLGFLTSGNGLAASPTDVLYLAPDGGGTGACSGTEATLRTIDPTTGQVTSTLPLSGDLVGCSAINAMSFSCTGTLFGSQAVGTGGSGPANLVTIDTVSGVLSTLGTTANGLDALAWACRPSPSDFFTVDPCRLIDTRDPPGPLGGPALVASADRTFPIVGICNIPSSAKAVSVNIAVTAPTAAGNLRLHPARTPVPVISSINYISGQTRSNNAVVPLNELGELAAFVGQASGRVHFILDVNGYFQ